MTGDQRRPSDIELGRLAFRAQQEPDNPDVMEALGRACLPAGKVEIGLTALMRATELDPGNLVRIRRAAKLYLDLGHMSKAVGLLRRFVAVRPDDPDGLCELGRLLVAAGEPEGALEAFRMAEPLPGGVAPALIGMARLHLAAGAVEAAVQTADRLLALDRRNGEAYFIRGSGYLRSGRTEDGIIDLQRCVLLDPGNAEAHHNLVLPLLSVGRDTEARGHGGQALVLKDREASALPRLWSPAPPREPGCNVVSFSLWGDGPTYLNGAVANAAAVPRFYPGWEAWFHVDESVSPAICDALAAAGARVIRLARKTTTEGLFWRFLPASDPSVARVIARDCDSLPSEREAAAVRAWIASGRVLHVMRDHVAHCELVLAGMWGLRGGVVADMASLYRPYATNGRPRWADQDFLAERIWPILKTDCVIHDSVFPLFGAEPFPPVPDKAVPGGHIGAKLGG